MTMGFRNRAGGGPINRFLDGDDDGRIRELEANERAYEQIIGPKTYQQVADEIANLKAAVAKAALRLDEVAWWASRNADSTTNKDDAQTWRNHTRHCREVRDLLVESLKPPERQ